MSSKTISRREFLAVATAADVTSLYHRYSILSSRTWRIITMLHIDIPTRDDIEGLIRNRGPARVSLYLPTTPITQHAQGDRIALKNHTGEALSQLADHDKREVRDIEEMLFDLVDDDIFWEFQANSLAVFVTPESLRTFRLPNRLQPLVEVSDRALRQAAAPRCHRAAVRVPPRPRPEQRAGGRGLGRHAGIRGEGGRHAEGRGERSGKGLDQGPLAEQ